MSDKEWLDELIKITDEESQMTEKQKRILMAAAEIFAEKGYSATSTSEIARKADVAEGTIFRHYKTKKDLLLAISGSIMSKLITPLMIRDVNKILDTHYEKFEDFLRAVIVNRMEFAQNNIKLLKVLLQEVPFHPELQELFKKTIALPFLERFFEIIVDFQKRGQIIDIPASSAARLIGTPIIGYLFMRYLLNILQGSNDDNEIDLIINYIMHGLTPVEKI